MTSIEKRTAQTSALTGLGFDDIGRLGKVFAASGMFKDIQSEAQAIVKIVAGQELGIGPMQSMNGIHVGQGRTTLGSGLVGALIKRSGRYDYRIVERTETRCELAWFENGESVGASEWRIEKAQRAGLTSKDVWKKYPDAMLFARALTSGATTYCPDVFGGSVYTAEELGALNVNEEGELVVSPAGVNRDTGEITQAAPKRLTVKAATPPESTPENVEEAEVVEPLAEKAAVLATRQNFLDAGLPVETLNGVYIDLLGVTPPHEITLAQLAALSTRLAEALTEHDAEAFSAA